MSQRVDVSSPELLAVVPARHTAARIVVAAGLGALVVAAAAQVSLPVPFSPVPMTLQPLAVLAVGGLLGPVAGLAALVTYLAMGLAGLPVFAGALAGVPGGLPRLLGPTGGYLLSYPIVAAVTGWLASGAIAATERGRLPGVRAFVVALVAATVGMTLIHVGGASQLALLTGSASGAFRLGFVPFLAGDLLKVLLAAVLIVLGGARVRSWL